MADSKTTTDLNEIKKWAEARDGKPSKVKAWAKTPVMELSALIFPDIRVKIRWKKSRGTIGIKFSRNASYLFFTRIKRVTEKKAGFLN